MNETMGKSPRKSPQAGTSGRAGRATAAPLPPVSGRAAPRIPGVGLPPDLVCERPERRTVTRRSALTFGAAFALFGSISAASAAAPSVPEDARLASVRAELTAALDRTAAAGLPTELLVSKIREGLAKGIDGPRIASVVVRLADELRAAHAFLVARKQQATQPLVRAVAEARLAGVAFEAMDPLVRAGGLQVTRSIEVLADLSLRGYPAPRASALLKDVLARDPGALPRLPRTLDLVRTEQALTYVEATDALARGFAASESLDRGLARTMDVERRRAPGAGKGKADQGAGGAPGRSEDAPGRLPDFKLKGRPKR